VCGESDPKEEFEDGEKRNVRRPWRWRIERSKHTPPRVFSAKSAQGNEKMGDSVLLSAKECGRV